MYMYMRVVLTVYVWESLFVSVFSVHILVGVYIFCVCDMCLEYGLIRFCENIPVIV